jgi:hypothetical protein
MPPPSPEWGLTDWAAFVAVIIAAITGLALVIREIDKWLWEPKRSKAKRVTELDDPIDIHFLLPPASQRKVEYAKQDNREHLFCDIVLPCNRETIVELRINPKIKFVSTSFLFGCYHDDADQTAKERKPRPIQLLDPYGQGILPTMCIPGVTPGHTINARYEYRWNQEIRWNYLTIILGVKIKTFAVGEYRWRVYLLGDEKEIVLDDLRIKVTNRDAFQMECVNQDHEPHRIDAVLDRGVIDPLD